ncbi:glycosyltransferase family 61 protein, partial [Achromobacter xylosoxidans]|uniref:glycosyltransferase family 61 protein n=1 Tax=Alcaligenes xylosoxydans xylosoxydans TaxID=85698 RepID=UPI001F060DC4
SERGKTNPAWCGNPEQLDELPGPTTQWVDGRTFFAGHHRSNFGHVLLEVLPRFWPDLDYRDFDALLFHPQRAGRRVSWLEPKSYAEELLGAATGGSQAQLRIVAREPLRIAEVTVASPAFWLKRGFSPQVRTAFDRVADRLT